MIRAASRSTRLSRHKRFFATLVGKLHLFARRRRDRQSLAKLDDHLLRDIGLDAPTAHEECAKPIWRA